MRISSRAEFLNLAGLVEGGTLLAAVALGWLLGVSPWETMSWRWDTAVLAIPAVLPMLGAFFLATGPRTLATELLGEALSHCRWYDLIGLAALAGFGEELLFRGVLQPWLSRWDETFALIGTNVAFGLLHALTPSYALLAGVAGLYLSWLTYGIGEPNLWRAIIVHALYDAIAFGLIVREYRRSQQTQE